MVFKTFYAYVSAVFCLLAVEIRTHGSMGKPSWHCTRIAVHPKVIKPLPFKRPPSLVFPYRLPRRPTRAVRRECAVHRIEGDMGRNWDRFGREGVCPSGQAGRAGNHHESRETSVDDSESFRSVYSATQTGGKAHVVVFLQTSPFTPKLELQPTEVSSIHWIPLSALTPPFAPASWSRIEIDISTRLSPRNPFVRKLLRGLVGKME